MPDATALLDAVDHLADRFRAMPQSRLLGAVPGHRSRAAAGLALARLLADRAQAWEEGPGAAPRELPDAGAFAVGDQIAVAGHDLAAALDGPAARAGNDEAATALLEEAIAAIGEVAGLCA
ncbi:hypothetical protein [Kitasatospora viridis]|uniref:Uncharacterized protein n=1 Tax=Kitasatospora viridis TaxID=281105 RepID=A0A561UFR1_9ACTN|nr:hypothetical protein [Kitasatospora viridis]TWF98209.1 hypothetical protein FHX73_112012 [Kitasatospora viridis]